jgi:hypothetical protein
MRGLFLYPKFGDYKMMLIYQLLCVLFAIMFVIVLVGAIKLQRDNDAGQLLFEQMQKDVEFYKREAVELNQSYKIYMDSIEVMIKQHAADLATVMEENKNLRQANQNMLDALRRKGGGGATVIDFSPESKINTALEQ